MWNSIYNVYSKIVFHCSNINTGCPVPCTRHWRQKTNMFTRVKTACQTKDRPEDPRTSWLLFILLGSSFTFLTRVTTDGHLAELNPELHSHKPLQTPEHATSGHNKYFARQRKRNRPARNSTDWVQQQVSIVLLQRIFLYEMLPRVENKY
jgi:hypothetical protein